ncbi:MAG TPA: aminotransferase class I/II-fold pyridoxal phosphate-dependent enzyme [Pyrinomonadaceae bacterium]
MQVPPFLLDEWLNEYHFGSVRPEFDLASSTGPPLTVRNLLAWMTPEEKNRFEETLAVYSAAEGNQMLRQAVADLHGVAPEDVQIVSGASEALLVLFFLASEPGANIVLPFPLYPPIPVEARLFGVEPRFYRLRRENNFVIDLDELKKLVDDKTKFVLVNSPHNPTGAVLSNAQMREVHDFAAAAGVPFVSDEVYHPIYHQDETDSAALLPHATVLGSFSKSLSLSGLRVGWIVDRDRARQQQYINARSYFTISNSPLTEQLALVALQHREDIFARTRRIATANLQLLDQFFDEWKSELGWVRPRGGMICFPWLKRGGDARAFCRTVAKRGTLLAPGDCFQMPEHFRLGFGVTEAGFESALQKIADHLTTIANTSKSQRARGI